MKVKSESELSNIEIEAGFPGNYQKKSSIDSRGLNFTNEGLLLEPLLKYVDLQESKGNFMVSYFSSLRENFVYLATSPLQPKLVIPRSEIQSGPLKIRFRFISNTDFPQAGVDENASEEGEKVGHRTKERKIGYIIEKVARWRNLYNGIQNSKGNTIRMTLEEAAKQVDISKKSLDDYLLQLRFGRKFGFNFEEHKNDKVGLLRAYVKKFKKLKPKLNTPAVNDELRKILADKGTPACKSDKCCVPPPAVIQSKDFTLS
jgi:hypothetical protein